MCAFKVPKLIGCNNSTHHIFFVVAVMKRLNDAAVVGVLLYIRFLTIACFLKFYK